VEYIGLIFEITFLALGIWVYRFSMGKIKFHPTQQPLIERFRLENKGWMRLTSMLLMAIMVVEIALHIFQIFNKKIM
jgi:hypothetical protein